MRRRIRKRAGPRTAKAQVAADVRRRTVEIFRLVQFRTESKPDRDSRRRNRSGHSGARDHLLHWLRPEVCESPAENSSDPVALLREDILRHAPALHSSVEFCPATPQAHHRYKNGLATMS